MKKFKFYSAILLLIILMSFESCGPIIVSSRPNHPTPPWFYPNRVVNVRYVYFPDFTIYYDLTLRNYLYLENGVWTRTKVLPSRFSGVNFRKSKQVRVNNYFDDNIKEYHSKRNTNEKGSRTTTSRSRRG